MSKNNIEKSAKKFVGELERAGYDPDKGVFPANVSSTLRIRYVNSLKALIDAVNENEEP